MSETPLTLHPRAVFLSYASQDADAAQRICAALRAAGVEIWFDADGGLQHGDAWDGKIRKQIRDCVLFIPLISANTQARHEGYFRIEWELAAERAMGIAAGIPFILPMVIDGTTEPEALVPDRFRKVQWTRVSNGNLPADGVGRLRLLWEQRIGGAAPQTSSGTTARFSQSGPSLTGTERRLAAIVFTDIVGYSRRMQSDEATTLRLVQADFATMIERCKGHGGEVLNSMGDGLLISFGSAVTAVNWALETQAEFIRRRETTPADLALEHRMGVHIGDVFRQETGGIAGDGVNIAARLEGKAPVGGLCVSQMVYDTIKGKVPMESVFRGPEEFKNIAEPIPVWHIAPKGSAILSASDQPSLKSTTGSRTSLPPKIPDYELLRPIGEGGYGEVWLARGVTGAYRAVKIVRRDRFSDAEPFEREFRGLKESMSGPLAAAGGIALLHVGRNEPAGFFYYVMELADDIETGRSIDPGRYRPLTLKEVRERRAPLPVKECLALGVSMVRELSILHTHGLVHRDIKPSNVILVSGVAKLADIGLVAVSADARTYVGTEGFVPPEGSGTPAADVFAAGKVLYELSTGFDRKEYPRISDKIAPADRTVFSAFNEVVRRACDPATAKRYPDAGALLADLRALSAGTPVAARKSNSGRRWIMAGGAAAALVTIGWLVWPKRPPNAPLPPAVAVSPPVAKATKPADPAAPAAVPEKSIAVIPFNNLSEEKDTTIFADGVHDDILTNLAVVRELHVISRTSVLQYRATTKTARQIGTELGVAFILEGTVRRAGKAVRVTGQLIDAQTDRHVWAKSYDRELTDIFAVQSELAQEIARALSAVISPQERSILEARPTQNSVAYERLVAARFADREEQAEPLLLEAVRLDPNFSEAWAALVRTHSFIYFNSRGQHTPERLAQARHALETALRLAPDSHTTIKAQGDFQYYAMKEWEKAAEHYRQALLVGPNVADILESLGYIYRRLGRWSESLAALRQAAKLDPGSFNLSSNLGSVLDAIRRYDEAGVYRRRCADLKPEDPFSRYLCVLIEFFGHGSIQKVDEWFATQTYFAQGDPKLLQVRQVWLRQSGRFKEADEVAKRHPRKSTEKTPPAVPPPPSIEELIALDDLPAARALAQKSLPDLQSAIARDGQNFGARRSVMTLYALLGDREGLLREGQVLLSSGRPDHWIDGQRRGQFANSLALLGDRQLALDELERCLRTPYAGHVHAFRHNPNWRAFKGDPRFEALLSDPKNNAPLF